MERGIKWVLLNAAIILGGGWLLTSMNFVPWFGVGLPIVVALGVAEYARRVKPLTYRQRQELRQEQRQEAVAPIAP